MKKTKTYPRAYFNAEVIKEAFQRLEECLASENVNDLTVLRELYLKNEQWQHDTDEEFYMEYRKKQFIRAYISKFRNNYSLDIIVYYDDESRVSAETPSLAELESIFDIFEKNYDDSLLPLKPAPKPEPPVIFIGHGGSHQWRDLKDHLQDKHEIKIEAYEIGARAGHTIRDILEDMLTRSSFAILVMTGEDESTDGNVWARQNVIHETGLFQGRLGFSRAIILLEEGTEEFSNIYGVQQIRFKKNNIKETFGEVLATLRREFGSI